MGDSILEQGLTWPNFEHFRQWEGVEEDDSFLNIQELPYR